MKILFGLLIVIAVIGLLFLYLRSHTSVSPTRLVAIDQLPAIIGKLQRIGSDGSFVVFMFSPARSHDETLPVLQYSIEGGSLGLDWVLMAPRNILDEAALTDFITRLDYSVSKREMDDVRYLRVEGAGIIDLGVKILCDFYHLDPQAKLELITEGFDWRP